MKTLPNVAADLLSELTRRRVTTSLGLASIQILISERKSSRGPASRRTQLVWHSSRTPFELWTWACINRTPADNATVALKN